MVQQLLQHERIVCLNDIFYSVFALTLNKNNIKFNGFFIFEKDNKLK